MRLANFLMTTSAIFRFKESFLAEIPSFENGATTKAPAKSQSRSDICYLQAEEFSAYEMERRINKVLKKNRENLLIDGSFRKRC